MDKKDCLIILRIHNKSDKSVQFDTAQGIDVLLTPDSVIDLYSFEVDDSESFAKQTQSESLSVIENQKIPIDKDDLDIIKSNILSYRQDESDSADTDTIKAPPKRKPVKSRKQPKSKKPLKTDKDT